MLEHDLVLKSGELYLVGNTPTDGSRERATGLYLRDTRHLCLFRATVNGTVMEPLSAFPHDAARPRTTQHHAARRTHASRSPHV